MNDPRELLSRLAAPFAAEDLEWRLQIAYEDRMQGIAVPYVTNRAIQNRLDDVMGPDRWHNEFKPWHSTGKRESQLCGISLYFEERGWITKWDGAEDSDIEPIKGGLSDSMKRAANQWGIGRVLYSMDTVWVNVEKKGKSFIIKPTERGKLDARYLETLKSLGLTPAKACGMVVRTIFQLKMEGYSQQAIANYLSSEGVLPPAAYKQQQGLKYQSGFQAVGDNNAWSPVAVRAILENPIYIGTLVQGKRGTPNYKIKQMKLRSKEDWCVVEKNHTPIISEELFTSVQHLLSLDTRTSPSEEVVQPLAGMLYCADCGRAMCRRSVKRGNRMFYYYVCSTHKRSKLCSSHSISQTALEEVVLRAIQKQIEMVVDIDQLIHEIGQKSIQAAKHRQLDMTIAEKEKQITEQKEYRMRLLEAFHDDLISRTEYDMMRQRYTQRIDALQVALASLHERRQALEEGAADTRNWVAEYTKFRKIDKLTREMVAGLIRRITISEGKQITIQFNYADELASYQQMIAAAAKEVG